MKQYNDGNDVGKSLSPESRIALQRLESVLPRVYQHQILLTTTLPSLEELCVAGRIFFLPGHVRVRELSLRGPGWLFNQSKGRHRNVLFEEAWEVSFIKLVTRRETDHPDTLYPRMKLWLFHLQPRDGDLLTALWCEHASPRESHLIPAPSSLPPSSPETQFLDMPPENFAGSEWQVDNSGFRPLVRLRQSLGRTRSEEVIHPTGVSPPDSVRRFSSPPDNGAGLDLEWEPSLWQPLELPFHEDPTLSESWILPFPESE